MRRRTGRSAGGALQQPQQLSAHRPAPGRRSCARHEPNGVLFADQWNNLDNRKAHYVSTGPEIWQQTDGKVDGFICAIGTGGTLAGVSTYLRERNKDIVIGVADPRGAAMYNLFAHGEAKASEGGSITEGIGLGRVTRIIEDIKVDKPYLIPDEEAVPLIFDLLEHEGLCMGGSTGINVAGAIRLAKDMGPGHTIVTILADYGTRYQSKLFNPAFSARERAFLCRNGWSGVTRHEGAVRKGLISDIRLQALRSAMPTDCLFREDSYLQGVQRHGGRPDRGRRRRARPHRVLRRLRRPARRPRRADHRDRRRHRDRRARATPMPARPRSRICRRPPPG